MSRPLVILYCLDMLALAILTLGNCKIGQTISSVAYELDRDGRWLGKRLRPTIDWLFTLAERDHCHKAHLTYLRITGSKP